MGFKPKSSLKSYYHIRPAQFLYPSEKVGVKKVLKVPFHYWSGQKRPAGNVTLFIERPKAAKNRPRLFLRLCAPRVRRYLPTFCFYCLK